MLFINPGSGPVAGAREEDAEENIKALIEDIGLDGVVCERDEERDCGDGRFCFILMLGEHESEIQIPGLPLAGVRFTGEDDQDIWNFPRLLVNGSSWVWKFAIECAVDDLTVFDDGPQALVRRFPAPPTLRGDKTYHVSIAELRRVTAESEKYLPCGVAAASESAAEALILAMKEMGYAA